MELTKEYFESYLEQKFDEKLGNLVTKEDLDKKVEALVTNEALDKRLEALITKEDLDKRLTKLVTKEDLDKKLETLVTKKDLDKKLTKLATKDDFDELKKDMEVLKDSNRTLVSDVQGIKETVVRIDKRDLEDSNSLAKSFVLHDNAIRAIRKDIKKLKLFVKYEEVDNV